MSVLLKTQKIKGKDLEKVVAYHPNPQKLEENQKQEGVIVDKLPEKPETKVNERAVLYYDPNKNEAVYEVKETKINLADEQIDRLYEINDKKKFKKEFFRIVSGN